MKGKFAKVWRGDRISTNWILLEKVWLQPLGEFARLLRSELVYHNRI